MPPTPGLEGILCPLHCDKGFIQDLLHITYVGLTTGVLRDLCYN